MSSQERVSYVAFWDIDEGLFKACFGDEDSWQGCQFKYITQESSSTDIQDLFASPRLKCVIIQEIGGPNWNYIIEYYKNGGRVVFFGIYGEFGAPKALSKAFGLNWSFSAYTKHNFQLSTVGKHILGDKVTEQQYSKANLLSVPEQDRILIPKCDYETFDQFKEGEGDDSDEDEEDIKQQYNTYKSSLDNQVPLALHRAAHGGEIAYIGFVNGDGNIPKFVRALCTGSHTMV